MIATGACNKVETNSKSEIEYVTVSNPSATADIGYSGLSTDIIYGISYVTGYQPLSIENGLRDKTCTYRLKGASYEVWGECLDALGYDASAVMSAAKYHNDLVSAKAMPSQAWSTLSPERGRCLRKALELEKQIIAGKRITW